MKRLPAFAALLLTLLAVSACSCMQTIANPQKPEVRSVIHRWGQVTADITEVITTITVYNPNSISLPVKSVYADVFADDIKMGHSEAKDLILEKNTETPVQISTKIENKQVPELWIEHLKRQEKSMIVIDGKITFDLKVTDYSYPFTYQRPFETDALAEFRKLNNKVIEKTERVPIVNKEITIFKITIKSATASWGTFDKESTQLNLSATIHNDNPYPIPVRKLLYDININQIPLANGETEAKQSLAPNIDTLVTTTVNLKTSMIDKWFVSHVSHGEKSAVGIKLSVVVDLPKEVANILGDTITVPIWETTVNFETDILNSKK